MRRIRFSDPGSAVRSIPDGSLVVLPQGCAEPSRFYAAFVEDVARFHHLRIMSGLQFGDYPFLARGLGDHFSYTTWHVGARVQDLVDEGRAAYVPVRYGDISRRYANADVIVVHTSTPGDNGELSLGVSVGITRELALSARLVIAEVSEHMPFTCGESTLSCEEIDVFIDGDSAPAQSLTRPAGQVSSRIAALAAELIPDGAHLQVGLGTIPDALLKTIEDRQVHIHTGMITDRIIEYIERSDARVVTGEVVGSERLFRFVHRNPAIQVVPAGRSHDPRVTGALPRFAAVNSALEVDLSGQVNAEAIGGKVVSGVGGSLDFMLGASLSPGGVAIIVLPSTADEGKRSRIVPAFSLGTAVTIPRHCVDYVVTEFGVAQLGGKGLVERARALAAIAHPEFRDKLLEAVARPRSASWT